jgi:hypothetical protein
MAFERGRERPRLPNSVLLTVRWVLTHTSSAKRLRPNRRNVPDGNCEITVWTRRSSAPEILGPLSWRLWLVFGHDLTVGRWMRRRACGIVELGLARQTSELTDYGEHGHVRVDEHGHLRLEIGDSKVLQCKRRGSLVARLLFEAALPSAQFLLPLSVLSNEARQRPRSVAHRRRKSPPAGSPKWFAWNSSRSPSSWPF